MVQRLKSDKVIERIFRDGKTIFKYPIKLVYLKTERVNPREQLQIGVSVSKRNFKNAVDRNRIKRQLREAIRQNISLIESHNQTAMMIIYVSKEKLEYSSIVNSISKLLKRYCND